MNASVLNKELDEEIVPKISVAMPVYNGEHHLAEAIESILAQTCSNFEFIIIDDGSTDNSLAILREYQKRDTRIRLVSRENRNLATTLNDIVDLAQGRWIARMDQDDIALPHRFEKQLKWLEKSDADICGSWVQFFGTTDRRILKHSQSDEAIKMELLFGTPFAHPAVMMRTALVKELRYDKAWEKCEDYDLWERAARSGWKMTNVPEVLLRYRLHDSQVSSVSSSQQQELTQKIRRRYWTYMAGSTGVKKEWMDDVLKLREPLQPIPNMDNVDSAFNVLLQKNNGEAQRIIFDHLTRLYFRAAATCPDVVTRWGRFNREFSDGLGFSTKIKLWVLSHFGLHSNSRLFVRLKKGYFYIVRSI